MREGRTGRSSNPGRVKNIPDRLWGPSSLILTKEYLSAGVKQQGREAEHSPPTRTDIQNTWINTTTPPYSEGPATTFNFNQTKPVHILTRTIYPYIECFKKSFTTLKVNINLFRRHIQCFELS
jgi:hypothetical protein